MKELNVSCIQRFSTGDGPGIRTTVFLKGCNLRCPWCHNPENISPLPQKLVYPAAGKKVEYGRKTDIKDVFNDVMEDIDYYRESGGGVTFSGGEPMLQPEPLGELCTLLKREGVATLIDTAGCVPWENFGQVIVKTDMFYYDYKTADRNIYKNIIKGDIDTVFSNLKSLITSGACVHVRIPLIPGINTEISQCEDICADLLKAGVRYVDLLPYHRLGSAKYDALGIEYAYKNVPVQSKSEIEKIKGIYKKYFITETE